MRHRINKQISERTALLAGVSHDLKTPLTRMRLQLAVMEIQNDTKIEFEKELKELEEMIDGYLDNHQSFLLVLLTPFQTQF